MTDLQQNRYDRLLRRVGGLVGAKSMLNDALGELFPVLDVENMPLELKILGGIKTFFAASNNAGVAASLNHVQLFNPADSGALVILERVLLVSSTGQEIEYAMATAALTSNIGNVHARDTRLGIAPTAVGLNRHVSQAGSIATIGIFRIETNVTFELFNPNGIFCLAPGTGITFANTTNNTTLEVTWHWRERAAESSELNL